MDETLRTELVAHLNCMFPRQRSGFRPDWHQTEYKEDIFRIFRSALERGTCPHGDVAMSWLRECWFDERPDLTEEDRNEVWEMCQVWSEWLYALEKRGIANQPQACACGSPF